MIVALIFVNRSFSASLGTALRRRNRRLVVVLVGVVLMLMLALQWPFARDLLRFGPLHLNDLAVAVGASAIGLIVLELLKWVYASWQQRKLRHAAPLSSPPC